MWGMTVSACRSRRHLWSRRRCTRRRISATVSHHCESSLAYIHFCRERLMKRRDVLKSALVGATALAAPGIAQAQGPKTVKFVPHADLASLDPVWTTADITR